MNLFAEGIDNSQSTFKPVLNYRFIDQQHELETIVIPRVRNHWLWELDTETTGLDPHVDRVIMMQIGIPGHQFVIDTRKVNPEPLRPYLESRDFVKVVHNANFDYQMILGSFGIVLERIYDTMLMEMLLCAGVRKSGYGLDDCALHYFNYHLDKGLQQSFVNHFGAFTEKQIKYAAYDVVGLMKALMDAQIEKLKHWNLIAIAKLENDVLPAFADMNFYGLRLNKEKWLGLDHSSSEEYDELVDGLNAFIRSSGLVGVDMFGEVCFNWQSQPQLLALLQALFPHIRDTNDQTLDTLYYETKNEFIGNLRKFRKLAKKTGTYGETYTNHVHRVTGRFHPRIGQLGTDTGRPSCKKPNVLNIPRDKRYRTPWEAGPGRKLITLDYGGCELRIMASQSGDPAMCQAFNEGKDLHSFVAARFTQQNYEEFVRKVEAKDPDAGAQRQAFKSINFGIAYGMGAFKFSVKQKLPLETAKAYIAGYKQLFNVMMAWLRANGEHALHQGWISTHCGRKRFFHPVAVPKEVRETWEDARRLSVTSDGETTFHTSLLEYAFSKAPNYLNDRSSDDTLTYNAWLAKLPPAWRSFIDQVGAVQREGGNTPLQGGNADITKYAMVAIRNRLRQRGYYPNVRICLQVYDELVTDTPESLAQEVYAIVKEEMIRAGQRVITRVPVIVEGEIADTWTK